MHACEGSEYRNSETSLILAVFRPQSASASECRMQVQPVCVLCLVSCCYLGSGAGSVARGPSWLYHMLVGRYHSRPHKASIAYCSERSAVGGVIGWLEKGKVRDLFEDVPPSFFPNPVRITGFRYITHVSIIATADWE